MPFFDDVCRRTEEPGEPRLSPAELSRLLGDTRVREALQDVGVASLLPPVGTEVFRRLKLEEAGRGTDKQADEHLKKASPHLKEREPLPFFYGAPPPELLYTPLEELDPFYQSQKTFIVLSRGNVLHRFNAGPAMLLLSPFNRLRTGSIRIVLSPWFQWFILFTLLLNCVFMTFNDSRLKVAMECVFLVVYLCEILLKVLSRGFCLGRFSFIRDAWNWLDLLIILTAIPAFFVVLRPFSVISMILRFLKIFSASPGLRKAVEAFFQSATRFVDVSIVTVFCLSILAIISTNQFLGLLRGKCVEIPPFMSASNFSTEYYHSLYSSFREDIEPNSSDLSWKNYALSADNHYYLPNQLDPLVCGKMTDAGDCPEGWTCLLVGKYPNYGYTGYNSFFKSLLSMFRFLTQDYWENLVQLSMRAAGKDFIFFLFLLVFPTCFLVLSLVLAVVVMVIVDWDKAVVDKKKQREEQFNQIQEVLARTKKKEEDEVAGKAALLEDTSLTVAVTEADVDGTSPSGWQRFRLKLRPLVLHPLFDLGVTFCLVVNIIIMATEHYPMTMQHVEFMVVTNRVFTVIYTVELLLRLVVLGRGFFQVSWHILDFLVVFSSLLELALEDIEGMHLLRTLRLLRLFRLARWWSDLQLYLKVVWYSMQSVSLILLVLIFMWIVVGLQLFHRDYKDLVCKIAQDCELPRWHMGDLAHTVMVVFRVLHGEWIEILWDCMEVSGPGKCVPYFIPMVIIGKLLILVLFLNLFLSSTTKNKLAAVEDKIDLNARKMTQMCRWTGQNYNVDPYHRGKKPTGECVSLTPVTSESCKVPVSTEDSEKRLSDVKLDEENPTGSTMEDCCCSCCPLQDVDTSRGWWRTWSNFRRICLVIVESKYFEGFMVFVILLSSMALVLENAARRPVNIPIVLDRAELVFILIFLVELLLKWIGFGFKRYFSNFYCWVDFLVLDVSLVSLVLEFMGISSLPLRALRTLRIPSRFKGLRAVLRSLVVTLPPLVAVMLVVWFVWLMFGILGVELFAGKFFFCFNKTSEESFHQEEVNNKSECLMLMWYNYSEVHWKGLPVHFNSVAHSYLTMLIMSTSKMSMDILYSSVDTRGVGDQPAYEASLHMSLYYLCFMVFGGFFCFQLFIRVFIRTLQQHRQELGGKHLFIAKEQWIHPEGFKKRFNSPSIGPGVLPPQNRCRAGLFTLVSSHWFDIFMMGMVLLDITLLAVEHDESDEVLHAVLNWIHVSLILVFLVEFILKIIALGRFYFYSVLNIIDFVVLIGTIAGIFIQDLIAKYFIDPRLFAVMRLLRLGRVLRLFKASRGIQTLVLGFVMSLPGLVNIGFLLFLLTYTYTVVGTLSFWRTKPWAMIDDMVNFQDFWSSLVAMSMVTPTSAWDGLLLPIMGTFENCVLVPDDPDNPVQGECGHPVAGCIFFTSYIVLYILLVVHLFTVVVLESFNAREPNDSEDPQNQQSLSDKHLQMFCEAWEKFDPEASQLIKYSELSDFCNALQDPLKIPKPNDLQLSQMDLALVDGELVRCVDVLQALSGRVFGEPQDSNTLKARLEETFRTTNLPKESDETIISTMSADEVAGGGASGAEAGPSDK